MIDHFCIFRLAYMSEFAYLGQSRLIQYYKGYINDLEFDIKLPDFSS